MRHWAHEVIVVQRRGKLRFQCKGCGWQTGWFTEEDRQEGLDLAKDHTGIKEKGPRLDWKGTNVE